MGRPRKYETTAEKQAAYRARRLGASQVAPLLDHVPDWRLLEVLKTARASLMFPGDQDVLGALIHQIEARTKN